MVNYSLNSCWHKYAESEAAVSKRQALAGVHHVGSILQGIAKHPPTWYAASPDAASPESEGQGCVQRAKKTKTQGTSVKKKNFFPHKEENQILSSGRHCSMRTSEGKVQDETEVLIPKTKRADKENIYIPTRSQNDIIIKKNCIPLKPSNELTNSTIAIDTHNLEISNQTLKLLPIKDEPQDQCLTVSQMCHI